MTFAGLHTHNNSYERAFEALCNQLFEQWLLRTYADELISFTVINGAGGDGGIEAYGVTRQQGFIGMQAKWFRNALGPGQIGQIRQSIKTALQVRPQLSRYIICLPRDLQSDKLTKGGRPVTNTEEQRLKAMADNLQVSHPHLQIECWHEHRLLTELQQPGNEGIRKYWFDREIISMGFLQLRFDLARQGWLKERYIPDLHAQGDIQLAINKLLYTPTFRKGAIEQHRYYLSLYRGAKDALLAFINVLDATHALRAPLSSLLHKIDIIVAIDEEQIQRLEHGQFASRVQGPDDLKTAGLRAMIDAMVFPDSCRHTAERASLQLGLLKAHERRLSASLLQHFSCTITGGPGTGKTHGVVHAVAQRLAQGLPAMIVQASSVKATSWANILQSTLGGLHSWTDFEILRALEAMAHTCDIKLAVGSQGHDMAPELTRVLICIDGLDEVRDDLNWLARIGEVASLHQHFPRIVFVFTTRPILLDRPTFLNDKRSESWMLSVTLHEAGDVPLTLLVPPYLSYFKIQYEKTPWILPSFSNALSLKLFCEEYAGQDLATIHHAVTTSLTTLLNHKIERLSREFFEQQPFLWSPADQLIRNILLGMMPLFMQEQHIPHKQLVTAITLIDPSRIDSVSAGKVLDTMCAYGILLREFLSGSNGLLPLDIIYSITYQSYADYFIALHATAEITRQPLKELPASLKFPYNDHAIVHTALILYEDHGIMVGENGYWIDDFDALSLLTLQLHVLRSSSSDKVLGYLPILQEKFLHSQEERALIISDFIKPRLYDHALGLGQHFIHAFMTSFPTPVARNMALYGPNMSEEVRGVFYSAGHLLSVELEPDDRFDGPPLLLAWSLASPDRAYREEARDQLADWAMTNVGQLTALLELFTTCNDPQIQDELARVMEAVTMQLQENA
ncbi:MAG: hypothetical protein J7621_05955 [Niastella sp.]|nr:hypothetical protein [Niastella sp.]